jgi:hypothetical protein
VFTDTEEDDGCLCRRNTAHDATHQRRTTCWDTLDSRGNRASTLGMPVQLGHDDRAEIRTLLERATLALRGLTYRRIEDHDGHILRHGFSTRITGGEQGTYGLHGVTDVDHLLEELGFLLVSARGVDDDDVESLCTPISLRNPGNRTTGQTFSELFDTLRGDRHWIRLRIRPVERDLCFRGVPTNARGVRLPISLRR